jgi:predicted alpha/beta hydrolase family esterase
MTPVRALVIPGLHGSGPDHWQTWLQARLPHAQRVEQDDWAVPQLDAWSRRIDEVVARHPDVAWVAVAHSFGCLALAHHLGRRAASGQRDAGVGVAGALFVAPADPRRFRLEDSLPQRPLGVPSTLMSSETDPWMAAANAARWAARWGAALVNLGDAGHINVDAGFGPFPRALRITRALIRIAHKAHKQSRIDSFQRPPALPILRADSSSLHTHLDRIPSP